MQSGEPAEGIFTASFEKHGGRAGDYYSVSWNWRKRETPEEFEELQLIAEFLEEDHSLLDLGQDLVCIDNMTDEEITHLIQNRKLLEVEQASTKEAK
jgi:hypothetical protein